jgi:hypothetical protein
LAAERVKGSAWPVPSAVPLVLLLLVFFFLLVVVVVRALALLRVQARFVHFKYLGCWCSGTVCEETDTETEPLHFAGCLIIETAKSWVCCLLLGWNGLLLSRCLHASALTTALHVVKVYVMCVCRRHMWAVKASKEGEGKRKEGETVLTYTKR